MHVVGAQCALAVGTPAAPLPEVAGATVRAATIHAGFVAVAHAIHAAARRARIQLGRRQRGAVAVAAGPPLEQRQEHAGAAQAAQAADGSPVP